MRGKRLWTAGLLAISLIPLLSGCSDFLVLEPKGPIGVAERHLIFQAFGLMLIVAVPVIAMSILIPWRYRASNAKATYAPNWSHSTLIEVVVWLVPALIVGALGYLVWTSTHRLDPYKPIASDVPPLEVEAVSFDWKWLFIYPKQGIATLNQLVFPTKTPLSLRITSDTVMTSLFVPQLGTQIYAMAGMDTRLNLEAEETGKYLGENTQYNGSGFSDMHFNAMATTKEDFDRWVAKVKRSPEVLDEARLAEIEKPSARVPVEHFSRVTPKRFESIIAKYMGMGGKESMAMPTAGKSAGADGMDMAMSASKSGSGPDRTPLSPGQAPTAPDPTPPTVKQAIKQDVTREAH